MMRYETHANLCSHRFTSASQIALVFFTVLINEDLNPENFNLFLLNKFFFSKRCQDSMHGQTVTYSVCVGNVILLPEGI